MTLQYFINYNLKKAITLRLNRSLARIGLSAVETFGLSR